ncbi:lytic transglycosylase domain-containing protein [Piscinibacter terrae]|uniref:Lytic transglycosylase domain-containing protein n=1 Tax=Piscinibacter terrae TaxID=2496871 RepID=A0A3N7JUZ9_9BURK|nr:lytic transglycosylase domain-containing protein [Albitalea terrae]RQP22735.1 lytic transglycosylase domain-containing protein [Albitalea terrae]
MKRHAAGAAVIACALAMPARAGLVLEPAWRPLGRLSGLGPRCSRLHMAEPFVQMIGEAAAVNGQDASLIKAIVHVESGFDAGAVSAKGAMGLMQLMPATAQQLGLDDARTQLLDPAVNLRVGAQHLARLLRLFPQRLDLALAAYNAGEGAVLKYAGIPPYAETQAYVRSVLDWYRVYSESTYAPPPCPAR